MNSQQPGSLFLEVAFQNVASEWCDILVAELAGIGFDSFNEEESALLAYIREEDFDEMEIHRFLQKYPDLKDLLWSVTRMPDENWNAVWESSYEPVLIAGKCYIRAPFHPPFVMHDTRYGICDTGNEIQNSQQIIADRESRIPNPESRIPDRESRIPNPESRIPDPESRIPNPGSLIDIVIEPKMSFGTAHHETTSLMIEALLEEDISGKEVLDMGCGTGVLAILASVMGASRVVAIDIDERAVDNAIENVVKNNRPDVDVILGDSSGIPQEPFDIILANINRNTLFEQIPGYVHALRAGGRLFLSGFYSEDLPSIETLALKHGLRRTGLRTKNNWIAARFNQ